MPWRVFGFIGLLIVVTAFSALNLEHRADVSFGFHVFDAVPVFLTSLIAFTLGAVLAVLLTMPRRRAVPPGTSGTGGTGGRGRSRFRRRGGDARVAGGRCRTGPGRTPGRAT